MIASGNFRPKAEEIAKRCGMNKSVVVRYFGGAAELHAIIAQEYPDKVLVALGIEPLAGDAFVKQLEIVRAVMTGWRDARP